MNYLIKVVAIFASIIGLMAIITGSRVLFGFFDPGYTYFTTLIVYNILLGVISVIAGIFIWMKNDKSILLSYYNSIISYICTNLIFVIIQRGYI